MAQKRPRLVLRGHREAADEDVFVLDDDEALQLLDRCEEMRTRSKWARATNIAWGLVALGLLADMTAHALAGACPFELLSGWL